MVQETGQPEPNTPARLVDWAQSLVARAKRARSVLSPWVQRALETGASGRPRPLSLFEGDGRALVERVTRQGEGSRVWRPDLGRVSPLALDRFGGEMVRRHQPLADKYRVEVPELDEAQSTSLVLAPGGAVGPAVMPDARQPGPPFGLPPMPAAPPSAPPALQRQAAPPPGASREQPAVRRQPGARVFSRVEEIAPTATRPAEPASPQERGTEVGALDEDRAAVGMVPGEQPADRPLPTEGEIPLPHRVAREQEGRAQRPASPPGRAPSPEVEGTPEIDAEREEQSTPASAPQVEAEGEARQLERQAEEDRPSPVPPPEVWVSEAEPASGLEMPPVGRREDEELPAAPSPLQVETAGAEPGPRPEVPTLDRGGGEERPMTPYTPGVQAAGAEPARRREVPPFDESRGEERTKGPPPPGMRVTGVEPALRAELPRLDQGEGEGRPVGPSLPGVQATGVEPSRRGEVPPLQRAPLEDHSPPRGERTEADVPQPAHGPESEAPAPAPGQSLPPEHRLEGEDVSKVPEQRPPSAGPRQPAQRADAGREPVGVPDERPLLDPTMPILRKAPRARPVDRGPVQRTAILPQARMAARSEEEPTRTVAPEGPLGEGFWPGAAARRTPGTRALPLRAPIQPVMEGTHAVPEAPQPGQAGLPVAPVGGFAAEALVQRLPLAVVPRPETESTGAILVQRQDGTGPATSAAPAEKAEPDLDQLARQVYPLVKRMLAVERERRFSR